MPTIHPSLPPEGAIRQGNVKNTSPPIFPVALGEVLEVTIGERAGPSRYSLFWKNIQLVAAADLPLHPGEKLTVRVEQLNPGIVLRLVGQEDSPSLLTGYLRAFRANPQALTEFFQQGRAVFDQQEVGSLLSETGRKTLQTVVKLMEALLCSPHSLKNPLFLKEYITNLGIMLESQWQAAVKQGKSAKTQRPADSLKGALLKLAAELEGLLKDSASLEPEALHKLTTAAGFTEATIKAIETQQMVNVHAQENGNKYLLQIPLSFPDGIRSGEIYIESDNNGQGEIKVKNGFKVVMFLTMDRLGDIMVEASLAGNKVGCAFKFADHEAQIFFFSFLEGLGELLRRSGYDCQYLTCSTGEDLPANRQDCRRDILRGEEGINVYI